MPLICLWCVMKQPHIYSKKPRKNFVGIICRRHAAAVCRDAIWLHHQHYAQSPRWQSLAQALGACTLCGKSFLLHVCLSSKIQANVFFTDQCRRSVSKSWCNSYNATGSAQHAIIVRRLPGCLLPSSLALCQHGDGTFLHRLLLLHVPFRCGTYAMLVRHRYVHLNKTNVCMME